MAAAEGGLLDWARLTGPLHTVACDDLDENPLVTQDGNALYLCDEKVPQANLTATVNALLIALRHGGAWVETERAAAQTQTRFPQTVRRFQWTSESAGARLLYAELANDTTVLAIEIIPAQATDPAVTATERPFALVTGNCSMHPMIHAADFFYCNSDGSNSDRNLGEMVTPEIVLAKFVHDVVMHGGDEEH